MEKEKERDLLSVKENRDIRIINKKQWIPTRLLSLKFYSLSFKIFIL